MISKFWITYDLGIKGDYVGLYTWLDKHNAEQCGETTAIIRNYQFDGTTEEEFVEQLKREISSYVDIRESDSIYIIYQNGSRVRGKYLFGSRKRIVPWKGMYVQENVEEDVAVE